MFFSQDILQRRGGKFGVIWIAATKARDLSKRDYASVNIRRTCEDLIRYITNQADPIRHGGPRPKFSLYLSSQLMYGVVKVFDKQQYFLFTDATSLSVRFNVVTGPLLDIDLRETREAVNTVDVVSTFRRSTDTPAWDPWFGLLKHVEPTDWQEILPVDVWVPTSPYRDISPDLRRSDINFPSSPLVQKAPFKPEFGSPFQAHPTSITLTEEPLQSPQRIQVPGEQDLPPLPEQDLALLGDKAEQQEPQEQTSVETVEGAIFLSPTRIFMGADLLNLELQLDEGQLAPTEETRILPTDADRTLVPPEDHGRRGFQSPDRTLLSPQAEQEERLARRVSQYQMELTEITPSSSTRRRRRQLLFCDVEMQISRQTIRNNIERAEETCRSYELAGPSSSTVKELFNEPTKKEFRHPKLRHLWTRNARSHDFKETDSDKMRPAWTVPDLLLAAVGSGGESERGSPREELLRLMTLGEPPLSPVLEVPEDPRMTSIADSRLEDTLEALRRTGLEQSRTDLPQSSMVSLEEAENSTLTARESSSFIKESEKKRSSSRQRRSTSAERSIDEGVPAERTVRQLEELATLHEVPEEPSLGPLDLQAALEGSVVTRKIKSPSKQTGSPAKKRRTEQEDKLPSPAEHRLLRRISVNIELGPLTTFEDVCPLTTPRTQAASFFAALLGLAASRKVTVEQEVPYDVIYIRKGSAW